MTDEVMEALIFSFSPKRAASRRHSEVSSNAARVSGPVVVRPFSPKRFKLITYPRHVIADVTSSMWRGSMYAPFDVRTEWISSKITAIAASIPRIAAMPMISFVNTLSQTTPSKNAAV